MLLSKSNPKKYDISDFCILGLWPYDCILRKIHLNLNLKTVFGYTGKFTYSKKYRLMPACANSAGWHGWIFFVVA